MEITIKLTESADIPFIKKLLSQIKGIKNVEISEEDKTYSWEEIESSEDFRKVLEQSEEDFKNGRCEELTDELLDEIFDVK